MKQTSLQNFIAAVFIISGFIIIFWLSNFIEKSRPSLPNGFEDQDLSFQTAKIKDFSLGMNGLAADWYWMQSLQYIGNKLAQNPDITINLDNLRPLNPRLLYPLLDNATSLDPQFLTVYSYGAIVLPAIDPEQAIKITEKGINNNPDEWRLYQHLGYIYWKLKNYEKAAETYEKGSKIKDAPQFMQMMVALMKSKGGSRDTARQIYQQMYESSQDTQTKEVAAINLLQLDSLEEQDIIQPVLDSFKEKTGRCPNNWQEIFPLLRNIKTQNGRNLRFDSASFSPVDPTDIPYFLLKNNDKCLVVIDTKKSKIPVYQ